MRETSVMWKLRLEGPKVMTAKEINEQADERKRRYMIVTHTHSNVGGLQLKAMVTYYDLSDEAI